MTRAGKKRVRVAASKTSTTVTASPDGAVSVTATTEPSDVHVRNAKRPRRFRKLLSDVSCESESDDCLGPIPYNDVTMDLVSSDSEDSDHFATEEECGDMADASIDLDMFETLSKIPQEKLGNRLAWGEAYSMLRVIDNLPFKVTKRNIKTMQLAKKTQAMYSDLSGVSLNAVPLRDEGKLFNKFNNIRSKAAEIREDPSKMRKVKTKIAQAAIKLFPSVDAKAMRARSIRREEIDGTKPAPDPVESSKATPESERIKSIVNKMKEEQKKKKMSENPLVPAIRDLTDTFGRSKAEERQQIWAAYQAAVASAKEAMGGTLEMVKIIGIDTMRAQADAAYATYLAAIAKAEKEREDFLKRLQDGHQDGHQDNSE